MRVTAIQSTVNWGGKKYGPFTSSKAQPFVMVPAELAAALNLPEYTGEVPVDGDDPESLKVRLSEAEKQLQEAQAQVKALESASTGLPTGARDRLIALKGIGEKLADEILEALNAPAQEE